MTKPRGKRHDYIDALHAAFARADGDLNDAGLHAAFAKADDDINDLNKKIDDLDQSMKENKEKRAAEKATLNALHAELTKPATT